MIYVIGAQRTGVVKIGRSDSPESRVRQLQTGSAEPLQLLATLQGDAQAEGALHRYFAERCVGDEWFDFGPADAVTAVVTHLPDALAAPRTSRGGQRKRRLPPPAEPTTRLSVDMSRVDVRALRDVADDIADEVGLSKLSTMALMAALGRQVVADSAVRRSVVDCLHTDLAEV